MMTMPDQTKKHLRIALCVPEFQPLQRAWRGEPDDATYIVQSYVASGLARRGHLLSFLGPSGLEDVVCTTDVEDAVLAPRTWSAHPWFLNAGKATWRMQKLLGIPYLNVFSNWSRYDACLRCLAGHDVVYERNGLYNSAVAAACRRLRLPYVVFFEADQILELELSGEPLSRPLRMRAGQILNSNLRMADRVICVSEQSKAHLLRAWKAPAEKVDVLPNGVDTQRFQPSASAREIVHTKLGIGDGPLVVFVGGFFVWHDVATLLDAWTQVVAVRADARLVLVGDGARRQEMTQRAAGLGVADSVHFTGRVAHAEIARVLAAADVAVAPYPATEQELWLSPLKLYEYMASGVAIVASASGQVAEVIQDGRNGLLTPPGDARALADALNRLIANPEERQRLARQARQDAVEKHSWEQYACRLEEILRTAATEHKQSRPG